MKKIISTFLFLFLIVVLNGCEGDSEAIKKRQDAYDKAIDTCIKQKGVPIIEDLVFKGYRLENCIFLEQSEQED